MHMDALLDEWRRRGHEAALLCGGPVSFRRPGIHLRRGEHGATPTFEIVNTPNPVGVDDEPGSHVGHPELGRLTDEVLGSFGPDVVHVLELESLSADVVEHAAASGARTLVELHNYFHLCSQRDLLRPDGSVCRDFEGGRACIDCRVLRSQSKLHTRVHEALRGGSPIGKMIPFLRRIPLQDTRIAEVVKTRSRRGRKPAPAEAFAGRRRDLVAALGRAGAVVCMSRRVAEIHEAHGLEGPPVEVLNPVTPWMDSIRPKEPVQPDEIAFGFLGSLDRQKGLDVLVEATARVQGRFTVHVHATGRSHEIQDLTRRMEGLPIVMHGPYRGDDLDRVLAGFHVGVVPSVWEEAFGLVAHEMIASATPVIASRIGGLAEQVDEGRTGSLVEPGSVTELAAAMQQYVSDPGLVRRQMESPRRTWSPAEYVDGWERVVSRIG